MKIIALHFKNVNSLAGEWNIRFDDPAFLRNHLFAISGPTGSGKTSVLDAISLALYGKTPRQENVADKRNVNVGPELVMTTGTGESFSEVIFESAGNRYKAIWKVHRSHNRADGAMQSPERKILFEEKGVFVAKDEYSKTTEAQKKIEEIVGLNFNQFMRAVMLPQGGFDSFLKSSREDKAAILEKLSGQGIYRKISKAVFERNKSEESRQKELQNLLNGIQLMPENEERDLKAWVDATSKIKASKESELKKNEEYERILLQIIDSEKNCQELRKSLEALATENRELDPSRKRLARGAEAQLLMPELEKLDMVRKAHVKKMEQKKNLQQKIPEYEQKSRQVQVELETRIREENALRAEDKTRNGLREKVSTMDSDILRLRQLCTEKIQEIRAKKERLEAYRQEGISLKDSRADVDRKLSENQNYEKANPTHKMLESEQAVISDRLNRLDGAKCAVEKAKSQFAIARSRRTDAENLWRKKLLLLKDVSDERDRSLSNDMNKIVSFVQSSLQEGDTCPVCGSPFHASHENANVSVGDLTATASRLNHLQARYETAKNDANDAEYKLHAAEETVKNCENELADKNQAVEDSFQMVVEKLKPFGFAEADLQAPQAVLAKISGWAAQWNACIKNIDSLKNQQAILDAKEKNLAENVQNAQKELSILEDDLEKRKSEGQALASERQKLFGNINVAEDRREWQDKIDAASALRLNLMEKRESCEKDLASVRSQLQSISDELSNSERDKESLEVDLQAKLREHSFASEEDLKRSRLSEEERIRLTQKIEQVSSDYATRQGQLKQAEEHLEKLRAMETGRQTVQTVKSKIESLAQEIESIAKELDEKKRIYLENSVAKKTFQKVIVDKDVQDKVVRVWNTLNDLIGSADGKKFVEYVQQLTLRKLITAANTHLHGLDSRYKIETDETGLNISLYDAECGTSRLAANLSGGETFLVSLSLALGLSSLASQRVRIDTLFLDEGFGSLDERKLQRAIEVLRNLGERSDKIVGVISHVGRLKEEISNHIEIVPSGSGHSKIMGPGVTMGASLVKMI